MTSCTDKGQHQSIVDYLIYKKPIRLDMTFSVSAPVSRQSVILVVFGQTHTVLKLFNYGIEKRNIIISFDQTFIVFLERRCDNKFIFPHRPLRFPSRA